MFLIEIFIFLSLYFYHSLSFFIILYHSNIRANVGYKYYGKINTIKQSSGLIGQNYELRYSIF